MPQARKSWSGICEFFWFVNVPADLERSGRAIADFIINRIGEAYVSRMMEGEMFGLMYDRLKETQPFHFL